MSISVHRDGSVAVVELDDGKANALSHERLAQLDEALNDALDASAVVLTGRPGCWCGGFDLATMTSGDDAARALLAAGFERLARLWLFPRPVVIACTGHALAAGAIALLVADRRVGASGDYRIGCNEVAIGLRLPRYAIEMARSRLSPSGFADALLGQLTDPSGAVAAGYLDELTTSSAILGRAAALAHSLASLDAAVVGAIKQAARGALVEQLRRELAEDLAGISAPVNRATPPPGPRRPRR